MGRQREKKQKSSGSVDGEAPPVDAQMADDGSGEPITTLAELEARMNAPQRAEESQDLEEAPVGETPPQDEIRPLRERIRTLDIQLDTARIREDELTGQVVALEGNVVDLRTQVGELAVKGEEIGSLKTEITTITEALDKERRRASELAEARNGLEEEANRLSSQVTQLTEMIDEAKSDVAAEATRAGAARISSPTCARSSKHIMKRHGRLKRGPASTSKHWSACRRPCKNATRSLVVSATTSPHWRHGSRTDRTPWRLARRSSANSRRRSVC